MRLHTTSCFGESSTYRGREKGTPKQYSSIVKNLHETKNLSEEVHHFQDTQHLLPKIFLWTNKSGRIKLLSDLHPFSSYTHCPTPLLSPICWACGKHRHYQTQMTHLISGEFHILLISGIQYMIQPGIYLRELGTPQEAFGQLVRFRSFLGNSLKDQLHCVGSFSSLAN